VLPGDTICRKCGCDPISGRRPGQSSRAETARRRRLWAAAIGGAVCLVSGATVTALALRPEPKAKPDCIDEIRTMRRSVQAAFGRGNPIPRCDPTPPGPEGCWGSVDVVIASFRVPGQSYALRPTPGGFELECLADRDHDGRPAVYRANELIDGLRVTPDGTR
jgi:hypothetical protein